MEIILGLIHNIALLVSLILVQQFLYRVWRGGELSRQLVAGLVYGVIAIAGIMTAVKVAPGVVFDGRSIVLGIAGLFGGPVPAVIAAAITGAYRLSLGGAGAMMGVMVIITSTAIGLFFHQIRRRHPSFDRPRNLWLIGVLIHVVMLALAMLLPGGIALDVLRQIAIPVLVMYPVGFLLISRMMIDYENYQKTHDALADSEANLRAIIDQTDRGIALVAVDGSIVTYNLAMERLTGYSSEEAQSVGWFNVIAGANGSAGNDSTQHARDWRDSNGIAYRESKLIRKDGRSIWVLITCSPVELSGQEHSLFILTDISTRKAAELELENYRDHLEQLVEARTHELTEVNARLEEASSAKNRFLASMSHEFRTPLNSMIGFSAILLKEIAGPLNAEQRKQLEMIHKSSNSLLSLINDILDFSRIEAGKTEIRLETFDPATLLHDVIDSITPLADDKGLSLDVDARLCDLRMRSDPAKVQQILVNLLGNAIKFTEEGGVALKCEQEGDDFLRVTVSDTGPGIPRDQLDRIFEEFTQVDAPFAKGLQSSGLGLAISRIYADLLGGRLTATSEVGKGSVFTLILPLIHPSE